MPRILILGAVVGCYTAAPATRDVNAAWRGLAASELEVRWGSPADRGTEGSVSVLHWSHDNLHVELPSASGAVSVGPGHVAAAGEFQSGAIWHTSTDAVALVQPSGVIDHVEGASLRWGPPNGANLHWGTIFGAHVGLGRLDTTGTPLPSGGVYIGGMLGPALGLVGTFSLVAGSAAAGGALGFAWGVAAQWWPVNRLWVRAGPALLLTLDPGFVNTKLHPGVTAGASYAVIKVGTLALDLRLDLNAGPSTTFGTLGVGINLN